MSHRHVRGIVPCCFVLCSLMSSALVAQSRQNIWMLENPAIKVHVDAKAGRVTVLDKRTGRLWRQPTAAGPSFRNVRMVKPRRTLAFESDRARSAGKPCEVSITLDLPNGDGDLAVRIDMKNRETKIEQFAALEPLTLDAADGVMAAADNSNGHLYPLTMKPFPMPYVQVSAGLDMPWVGICDLAKGDGYVIIIETADDTEVHSPDVGTKDHPLVAPKIVWLPSKKTLRYPRQMLIHFSAKGGYVALAKRYRAYVKSQGGLVPFSEKIKKLPQLSRLFGAVDVWGGGLAFARQAKAAGIEKMLIHLSSSADVPASPADIKAINELGYLTSAYDDYADVAPVKPGKDVDALHDVLPDNAVLDDKGERWKGWLAGDLQYMKRCPAVAPAAAEAVISKLLKDHPYLGRFFDVTTCEALFECYDPNHPLTRTGKREWSEKLLNVWHSHHLVAGGEHGVWWAVPYLDYIEGMMSNNARTCWPAGYLIRPKSKTEKFKSGCMCDSWELYEKFGIGHVYRAPLWELVFHDCICTTWYWGDSNDFLLMAAPEVTPKKDAFNVLYGTMPVLWADAQGSWTTARDVFLRTCRKTGKLHEALAGKEMMSHEFVTHDHAVQRTRFSDGATAIVNFGDKPYEADLNGKKYLLPCNGFAVEGPKVRQSFSLINGQPTLTVDAEGKHWSEVVK